MTYAMIEAVLMHTMRSQIIDMCIIVLCRFSDRQYGTSRRMSRPLSPLGDEGSEGDTFAREDEENIGYSKYSPATLNHWTGDDAVAKRRAKFAGPWMHRIFIFVFGFFMLFLSISILMKVSSTNTVEDTESSIIDSSLSASGEHIVYLLHLSELLSNS